MSVILSAPAGVQCFDKHPEGQGLVATLQRWWVGYLTWRIERLPVSCPMATSDGELIDVGATRPRIEHAVGRRLGRTRVTHRSTWEA